MKKLSKSEQPLTIRNVEVRYDAQAASVGVELLLEQGQLELAGVVGPTTALLPGLCGGGATHLHGGGHLGDKLTLGALRLAGEVVDAIKKWSYQGHLLDQEALLLELGDVLWYLALIGRLFGWTLEEMVAANVAKLRKLYPGGFEAARSIHLDEEP